MRFTPEEKTIISFYNTSSRQLLISEMETAVEHIQDAELIKRTQLIINKLTFMTDEEFELESFVSDIDTDYNRVDGFYCAFQYDNYADAPGQVPVTLKVGDKSVDYEVTLAPSPVASVELSKEPTVTVFDEYFKPSFIGAQLKI